MRQSRLVTPSSSACEVRRLPAGAGATPVLEEEDRRRLHPRRAKQAQAGLLRRGERALVGKDDAVAVRPQAHPRDDAAPGPANVVGAGELLLEQPDRRALLADEHAPLLPVGELAGGLLRIVGANEPHGVPRASRQQPVAGLRR